MEWLVPDWPAPAGVRAVCTTRDGGVSAGAFAGLNLGDHVGDDAQHVARNRAVFERAIGARPLYLQQVHGCSVARLDGNTEDGVRADGCWTSQRGIACTIMVADCLPVLFATEDGAKVAAAHAGWRGLAGGILEATVRALAAEPASLLAWLGPAIGPQAFEVGADVKEVFEQRDAAASNHFKPYRPGKWLCDLPALARMRLQAAGVGRIHGNDSTAGWCTVSNPSRFFSYRRDGATGRFAAAVWRT